MDLWKKKGLPMVHVMTAGLYEFMVIVYAVSIILYIVDYLYKVPKAKRRAFWLVSFVWVAQTLFLANFIWETKRFPILSLYEGIFFYAWLLITISIALHCFARADLPVFFVNILGFVFMTIHTFAPNEANVVATSMVSEMLLIHIGFGIVAYAAFSISFVFAILYMLLYRVLKQKKFSTQWTRLPSLDTTTKWIHFSTLVGICLLGISLILGSEWALLTLEDVSVFDFKIIGSFILALMYSVILYANRTGRLVGTTYAWVHVYTYMFLILNFFLGNSLSNFHVWY